MLTARNIEDIQSYVAKLNRGTDTYCMLDVSSFNVIYSIPSDVCPLAFCKAISHGTAIALTQIAESSGSRTVVMLSRA